MVSDSKQPASPNDPAASPSPEGHVCAFGTPWQAHFDGTGCSGCEAETARLRAEFQAGVVAGRWDADGYEPNDRKPLARVQAHRQQILFE